MIEKDNSFGRMAKLRREAEGLSQSQLAAEFHWKRQDISAMERGLTLGKMRGLMLARRLGIPESEVKVRSPKPSPGRNKPKRTSFYLKSDTLGFFIRERRLDLGVTQKEISAAAGQKSNDIVSRIEANQRSASKALQEAFHETLGITFGPFLD